MHQHTRNNEPENLVQHFSIDGRSQRRGADLFQERLHEFFAVNLAIDASNDDLFCTQVSAYRGSQLRFASLRFTPHSTYAAHGGTANSPLIITLQREGVASIQQDGRECRLEAGDMVLIDPSRPFCIEAGEILTHSLYLQRHTLRSVVPEIENLTARVINCREGSGAMFCGLVDQLFRMMDSLSDDVACRIADALPHVLGAVLLPLERESAPSPTKIKAWHKQRIMRFARQNLPNHELDAGLIAKSVNLSTRYVYELFEDEDQPLMKWIWSQRLERCRVDLCSATIGARSISDIAFGWGFNDLAHFSRAFRQRFGYSPREFRARQRSSEAQRTNGYHQ